MNHSTLNAQPWVAAVAKAVSDGGGKGGYLVSMGTYRPDLVRVLATALGYGFIDFRAEFMAPLGIGASGVPLERIYEVAADPEIRAGIVIHNTEGLLSTRSAESRKAWFAGLLERPYDHAVIITLALYGAEAPTDNPRVVHIDPTTLPDEKMLIRLATR